MKMFKGELIVLIIIYIRDSSCVLDTVYNAGKEVWKLYSIIEKITSNVSDDVDRLPNDNAATNEEIRNQINEIHEQLDHIEKLIHSKILHDSFNSRSYSIMIYKGIDTLEIYISSMDEYYGSFRHLMNETSYPSEDLQKFLAAISSNVVDNMRMIRSLVMDENNIVPVHQNLISAITGSAASRQSELCNGPQIISRVLIQLFTIVMIAEMKSHIIFAIRRMYHLPTTTNVGAVDIYNKAQFERQLRLYVDLFSLDLLVTDSVYVRACDPINHNWIRGQSFYEFEGTFQTTIFHYNSIHCSHDSCSNALSEKAEQCHPQFYDDRTGCSTRITDCIYLDAVRACVLKKGAHKFQYIDSWELGLLGKKSECPRDNGYIIEGGMTGNSSQGVCACKCYGNDNKIGLFMIQSHVESNMVITGIRFVRQDQILYIQPREGKLDADGHIPLYSERWMHIPKDIESSQIHSIDEWNKLFFFDDLGLPAGFALIGVGFNHVKRGFLSGFAIKICGVPFDYGSGKLELNPNSLVSMQSPNENPGEPLSFRAISSVYAHSAQTLSPTNKRYILLKRSELKQDFGQSTLPLFDAAPIITHPPSVLGGIGIFHKGVEGYAGFISLRIYGMRYAEYFTNFTSTHMAYYMANDRIIPTN